MLLPRVTHEIHKHGCCGGGSTGGIHFPSCINCPTYKLVQQTAMLQVYLSHIIVNEIGNKKVKEQHLSIDDQ